MSKPKISTEEMKCGGPLYTIETSTPDVVAFAVLIPYTTILSNAHERNLMSILSRMCGDDTKKRTKAETDAVVTRRGADIEYISTSRYIMVTGRTPKKHFKEVFEVACEGLYLPKFTRGQFESRITRYLTELQGNVSDPEERAEELFAQNVFTPGHPAYKASTPECIDALPSLTREQVVLAHAEQVKGIAPQVFVAGDTASITASAIDGILNTYSTSYTVRPLLPEEIIGHREVRKQSEVLTIPDKENTSVVLGQAVPLTPEDPDYYPLNIAIALLGKGFNAHLTQTIRERDGLTYSIYASLMGVGKRMSYAWFIDGSFAPTNTKRAIATIQKELNVFLKSGITPKTVAAKKDQIINAYWTNMQGVSEVLYAYINTHLTGLEGDVFTKHVEQIEAVTPAAVKKAAQKYIRPTTLTTIVAGSVTKTYTPLAKS